MAARRGVPMGPWAAPPPLLPRLCLSTRAGPPDPYAVLGVGPEASPAEIRAAFLARCKEVHPDGDPGDPSRHERFLLLAEAYGALSRPCAPPGPPPRPPTHGGATPRPETPPRADPNRRYWEQFRPPGPPPRTPPHRLLGLCLLLALLGGVGHALAYRYVAGAHAAFLDERDRVLTAAYERARSRAGSQEEVLRRLWASRQRRQGGGGGAINRPSPPSPSFPPSLGPPKRGVPIAAFCQDFNERSRDVKAGIPLRVRLLVHPDRSYDLSIGPPPTSYFLKAIAGIEKGAARPGHEEVGVVSLKHLYEVALVKQRDPALATRGTPLPALVGSLVGSARSLGLRVVPRLTPEDCAAFQRQRREQEAAMAAEEEEGGAKKK